MYAAFYKLDYTLHSITINLDPITLYHKRNIPSVFSGRLMGVRYLFTPALHCVDAIFEYYTLILHTHYTPRKTDTHTHTVPTPNRIPLSIFHPSFFPIPFHIFLSEAASSCWTLLLWSFFIFFNVFILFHLKKKTAQIENWLILCVGVCVCECVKNLSRIFMPFYWCAVVRKPANCCMNFSNENFIF